MPVERRNALVELAMRIPQSVSVRISGQQETLDDVICDPHHHPSDKMKDALFESEHDDCTSSSFYTARSQQQEQHLQQDGYHSNKNTSGGVAGAGPPLVNYYFDHDSGSLNLLDACIVRQQHQQENTSSSSGRTTNNQQEKYRSSSFKSMTNSITSTTTISSNSFTMGEDESSISPTTKRRYSLRTSYATSEQSYNTISRSSLTSARGDEGPLLLHEDITVNDTVESIVNCTDSWEKIREKIRSRNLVTSLGVFEVCLSSFQEEARNLKKKRLEEAKKAEAQLSKYSRLRRRLSLF